MSLLCEMTDQAYDLVLTQLAGSYEFIIRDDRSGIQLRIKAIGSMLWQTGLLGIHQARI